MINNDNTPHEPNPPQPMKQVKRKQILWVEDDKLLGSIVSERFKKSECQLVLTKTGEEALTAIDRLVPDAIVVDLLLPGSMNGFEFLAKIKDDKRLEHVPKMVLSNLSREADMSKARDLGVEKFMVKASMSLEQTVKAMCDMCF